MSEILRRRFSEDHIAAEKRMIIMAIKMRVVYYSKNLKTLSEQLSTEADCKADTIPPAYNIEKQKLLVVCTKAFKNVPDDLARFLGSLDKTRAANVVFVIDGKPGSAGNLVDKAGNAGTNVIADTMYIKSNLFGQISAADVAKVTEWKDKIVASLS